MITCLVHYFKPVSNYPLYPPTVATLVHILPTTWAMEAMTDLSMRGLGLVAVLPEIAILLGYAVIFFVIGARRFKWE